MKAVIAAQIGEEGFVPFLGELVRLGVLTRDEKRAWLALHGAVMQATLPPLDDGQGVDHKALDALAAEFGVDAQ